ncbi:MAG: RND transporter [Desulfuromonadales bacterium]|nr:RND transporter [Desulfuromonadales bacterium]
MKRLLSQLSYPLLILFALLLGLAPFHPEPHLLEKLRLLRQGALSRPLDLFDLLFHLAPALLLMLKLVIERPWQRRR